MSEFDLNEVTEWLDLAQDYAEKHSGCQKVKVGSLIVRPYFPYIPVYHFTTSTGRVYVPGANRCIPDTCKTNGCHRVEVYGEDSKNHRLPADCRALHSELDAITRCAKAGASTKGAIIAVTRYPCEACARAIVAAGISKVFYGRKQEISEETKQIFLSGGVTVTHVSSWDHDDTER